MRGTAAGGLILVVAASLAGCQELADVWNGASAQGEEDRLARERFIKEREAQRTHDLERVAQKAARQQGTPEASVELVPGSPAQKLRDLLDRRLACASDECRKAILDQIRGDAAILLPGIRELVSRQPEPVVVEAIRLAGLFRHVGSIEALGRAAMVGGVRVRSEAVWALGEIRDPRGLVPLDHLSRVDASIDLVVALCRAVGTIGVPAGAPILERLVDAGDARGRVECIRAAGDIGTSDVLPALRRAAANGDAETLEETRRALAAIPGAEAKKLRRRLRAR
ncbi:MAG: HEAT repeat domain-containing protein [Deltaproteobacteria bacterium]|nr:HEAT repeat domain-containing protein [Deltaproteobacteria bacterium]